MATKKNTTTEQQQEAKKAKEPAKNRTSAKAVGAGEKAPKRSAKETKEPAYESKAANEPASSAGAANDSPVTQSEPAEVSSLDGVPLPAARGKAGVLGGPKDRGIKPEDKLALPTGKFFTFERVRSLNPKSFYCAMRWDYHVQGRSPEEGKRWWANKKILVINPANGSRVVVRAVDYGPHENTGLTISLSPGAIGALGIDIGDEVEISFADQKAHQGVLEV